MTQIQITLILPPPRSTRLYYPRSSATSPLTYQPTFKLIPDMNKTQSTSRLSSGAKTLGHATTPVSKPSSGAPDQVTHMPFFINPGTPGDSSKATKVLSSQYRCHMGLGVTQAAQVVVFISRDRPCKLLRIQPCSRITTTILTVGIYVFWKVCASTCPVRKFRTST